ncbi:unnamed protein product [Arabidopsis arenosa]|uniref:AN1-type domain-containing protein n=1 Tax=Arabidopsis arenosa TaxID=38785 RepID=A0A8S2A5J7_ARAAE|nr:unnamed protein product [Arabidopsis arenosa]
MLMTERGRAMWRTCLASAFRTALACTIVGSATLYGPEWINRHVAFPAFSYVAVILIITDATLGDTLRGCWLALYATCQSVGPAIVTLKLIGPARLTAETTALAAALAAFVVVLPNSSTHLVAKRIALGQIVLIYLEVPEKKPVNSPPEKNQQQRPNRCTTCRKWVGLTGFKCLCGTMYCWVHRYPEIHGCSYDFKSAGREEILKANPLVKAAKLHKI